MNTEERIAEAKARYLNALHAMQSGVRMMIEGNLSNSHSPKHLRVGVNSALMEMSAVAKLCMDKGVFTELEYYRTLAHFAEAEQADYEQKLTEKLGMKVTLR